MTVEDVLKRRMKELLLKETPYVLEEARFGMFDLAVYVPEDCAFEGLCEALPVSAVRACNRYLLDGTCADRKKTFLSNYEPEYDDQCLLTGFRDRKTGALIPERDFNDMLADRRSMKKKTSCDAAERRCEYLIKRLSTEQCFAQGTRLKQGLHLLEFKSDHDDVNRFLEQLPHYAMLGDYVWLVLGERQKEPKWLPSYVGIFRERDDGFVMVKDSQYLKRLPPLNEAVLRECGIEGLKGDKLYSFMRKWFINSIFYRAEGLVVPMDDLDSVLKEKNEKGKQSRLF
ncbi:MAG: hypothetical protein A4E28_03285 [Methanocella sp. PtaU1.Bin125]|nr:MAG: hypothetical protein A4E28_03285 [Methanocella sp. PtaU1.Bin125]